MVLEGDNLWFCHQIEVPVSSTAKTHAIKTPASDITRCSIQFNYKPICDDDFLVTGNELPCTQSVLFGLAMV